MSPNSSFCILTTQQYFREEWVQYGNCSCERPGYELSLGPASPYGKDVKLCCLSPFTHVTLPAVAVYLLQFRSELWDHHPTCSFSQCIRCAVASVPI